MQFNLRGVNRLSTTTCTRWQKKLSVNLTFCLYCLLLLGCSEDENSRVQVSEGTTLGGWSAYGGAPGGGHYSSADQINANNLHKLKQVWVHRSGDYRSGGDDEFIQYGSVTLPATPSGFQATPIIAEDKLYYCTPFNSVISLNPLTGEEYWRFDPEVNISEEYTTNCRGVSSWVDDEVDQGKECRHRIIGATIDGRLFALDGESGKPCFDFSDDGMVDLNDGLGDYIPSVYGVTSPPAILNDLIILGAMVDDNISLDVPGGVVRAYNVKSGELVWYWDPIPPGQKPILDEDNKIKYQRGTTNVWSIISVDTERNLVFVPTGNTSPDFYGGARNGLDYFSSSVVALDGNNGELVWHFQTVHHDLWDYDVPSQPTLFEMNRNGEKIPALAQPTKMGHLFILNRETGEPLFPVEERPVPQEGAVPGEVLSKTQPFPVKPKPFHSYNFGEEDAWGFTFWDRGKCKDIIKNMNAKGIFTPPSLKGTVLYPSQAGGNNWGSPAIDGNQNILVLNTQHLASGVRLHPRENCDSVEGAYPMIGTPYCAEILEPRSPLGAPCSPPPWSTLAAVNLDSGEHLWQVALGTTKELHPGPFGLSLGSATIGGPMITKSGLVFIASTGDQYLRAFSLENGEELWKSKLPTSGNATPMSFRLSKSTKQYILIAAGGHWGLPSEAGDYLIAYALED